MNRLRSVPQRAWSDVAVLSALSLLGVLGFETSFGDYNFLLAGLGGLIVGTGIALLGYALRLSVLVSVLAAILAYFLLGTPFTMPDQGVLFVLPGLTSVAGLAIGAVFGWADIVTLGTPVEAPYYMPVLPYFAVWLIALVGTMLAVRWLPRRPRTVWRASGLLVGPVVLYVAGILMGTDETFYAGIRGIAFGVIALVWLGWRRSQLEKSSTLGTNRLLSRKLVGTGTLILGTILIGSLAGSVLAPVQAERFVLREEIQPPFDPLQFPSPLAGFRQYTKTLADTPLFTVEGLETGQMVRLASMDAYDGKLWNVAGVDGAESASAGFRLVGRTIPDTPLITSVRSSTVTITGSGYTDVWLPGVGYPTTVDFDDQASSAQAENLRYNAGTGTAVLTSGVKSGYRYTTSAAVQQPFTDEDLVDVPVAALTLPPAENIPDVVVAKALEYTGAIGTPIDQLRAIQKALKTQGFLSHGLASDGIPSRAGHGADRIDELFTRSQMVGDQEQYAAAMALMARSLNLPARVVMGFAPEVPDGAASVEVTGSDVTAWVEVAFDDVGWVPFFPTPDQTDVPQDQTPKPKSVPQPQVRQPPRSDNQSDNLLTAVEIDDTKKDDKDRAFVLPGWAWLLGGTVGIPLLLILGPVLVIGAIKARRRRKRRGLGRGDTRVAGAWDEVTDGYAELGFEVPRGTTRLLVAADVEAQLDRQVGPAAASIRLTPLAELVDRAVFNGQPIGDDVVEQSWADALESLRLAEVGVGRLRRMLSRFRVRTRRDWSRVDLSTSRRG
ncbi:MULTISPECIES: transglutaminase domain-containing protein [Cryobacterium]|uniref:Transglutaminase domain-containing protein n=1 Tax=Cryobacterium breve TaxID=1259258 RepID=A0ABY2J5U7_9MICO|nr:MULTISPECIES: transglutaminase domain-containing protein [Cryobacterium]TFC95232.1 transglutaminase domain-containing protein [Cryobacterium sp. TmT3-12]TFD00312.1 transglutaminase domain-containing protein [Cryobacterium breve]